MHALIVRQKLMSSIPITKLDAARRQTDAAISLWFHEADPVSIHTLGAAALQILHDLGDRIGEPAGHYDPRYFREETFAEWKRIARQPQNFFKHADRPSDPDAVHHFRPARNEMLLSDCVYTYRRVADERTSIMRVFWTYFMLHHPELFEDPPIESSVAGLKGLSRQQFFKDALPLIQALGA